VARRSDEQRESYGGTVYVDTELNEDVEAVTMALVIEEL
jgi:hypothetical protein